MQPLLAKTDVNEIFFHSRVVVFEIESFVNACALMLRKKAFVEMGYRSEQHFPLRKKLLLRPRFPPRLLFFSICLPSYLWGDENVKVNIDCNQMIMKLKWLPLDSCAI